jgi:hypothetical protein
MKKFIIKQTPNIFFYAIMRKLGYNTSIRFKIIGTNLNFSLQEIDHLNIILYGFELFWSRIVTKVIIIPEENLDRYYKRTVKRLGAKYHSRPSALKNSRTRNSSSTVPSYHQCSIFTQNNIPMGKLIG